MPSAIPSVLHISTSDNAGGSAKSAYKIHQGLKRLGAGSRILVGRKERNDEDIAEVAGGLMGLADKVALKATGALGLQYLYVPSSPGILRHPWFLACKTVQIYNTHGNYLSHSILPALARAKPLVWRLSDMWPMTGHCAYSGACERWKTGCGSCPDLSAYPALPWDTTRLLWRRKRSLYARAPMTIVAPSQWMLGLAESSPLLAPFPKRLIRNGIDTEAFRPRSREESRRHLELPQEKRIVLFLANNILDPVKGFKVFAEAINSLWEKGRRDLLVVAVGRESSRAEEYLKAPVRGYPTITDRDALADAYGAADCYAHSASMENLPNTVLEALACGRPTVAFDAGGVPEIVITGRTGYLARNQDVADFAHGISLLVEGGADGAAYDGTCRRAILESYTLEGQAKAFYDLHLELAG